MSSDDQLIESSATDWVQFPVWVLEDIDLSTLGWAVSFNPTDTPTTAPVAATIVAGTAKQTQTKTGPRSDITVEVLVGSGPGGTPLAAGRWHCFAHTSSGPRLIVFYLGVLTVAGVTAAAPSNAGGYDGGLV